MPQWGTSTANESKPNWLTATQLENCYAVPGGWAIKRADGTEEILVAIRTLDTRLGAPTITKVAFSGALNAGATGVIKVSYNEKVLVTGTPTLVVTGSVAGAVTATYASINTNSTILSFNYTVPAAGNVLRVAAQSLVVTGATIKEAKAPSTLDAEVTISSAVSTAAGTKTTVA